MSLTFTGLDHPAVAAEDTDALAGWCCDVLGYEVAFHKEPGGVYLLRAPDGTCLEVMPRDDTPRPERTNWTPGWSHLALRVANLEDAIAWLDAKGVRWSGEVGPAVGGGRLRSFYDPEGNAWQVVERPV